jgi:hypothetical protein
LPRLARGLRRLTVDMASVRERGDIYFAYRPRIGEEHPESLAEVQRLYAILSPSDTPVYRRLVIGRKRLPDIPAHERNWAFVDRVTRRPEALEHELEAHGYETKTRGKRELPAARPAGEGVYAIVEHAGHTHLAYALELPERPGAAQHELGIEAEASYIVTVRNPQKPGPPGAGLEPRERPDYPKALRERFANRRFAPLEPEFLDYEGTELILIGAREEPEQELGIELDRERESIQSADIFNDLKMQRSKQPIRPLVEGAWA